ncbi:MAG: hypothetical protein HC880_02755 [Bacteroidia bacterium]|nr:hypothetical protein [Bacteroidia bacterium]
MTKEKTTSNNQPTRSPYYYIRKRLWANKPAVFGMAVIVASVIISILGYSIMPDKTPYADDRADQISKKPPGFRVRILKVRKNLDIEEGDFFTRVLFGQESKYETIPIETYRLDESTLTLYAQIYGEGGNEVAYPLVDVVEPLYVGDSRKLPQAGHGNYHDDPSDETVVIFGFGRKYSANFQIGPYCRIPGKMCGKPNLLAGHR